MTLYLLHIVNWLEQHQLPCLFKSITHVDCPGCGFQRSGIFLLKGELVQSVKMYPALLPILFFFAFLLVNNWWQSPHTAKIIKMGIASIFIIILSSYIYKLTT